MTFSPALAITVASDGAAGAPYLAALAEMGGVDGPGGVRYPVAAMAWSSTRIGLSVLCAATTPALAGIDAADLLAAPDIRAVVVACADPSAQADAVELALAARKHVLATLPLGPASRIASLIDAAARAGVVAATARAPLDVHRFVRALVDRRQGLDLWSAPVQDPADAIAAAIAALPEGADAALEHLERAMRLLRRRRDVS